MLYQASNVSPSTMGGVGNGIIDVNSGFPVSWQLNGTSAITAYKIDLYKNDTDSTFIWSSGKQSITPTYPINAKGVVQYIKLKFDADSTPSLPQGTLMNGVSYKFLITQFWNEGNAEKSIIQTIANVFYGKTIPTLELKNFDNTNIANEINSRIIYVKGIYTQQQETAIRDVTWRLSIVVDGKTNVVNEYTVNNTQVLEYKYETLINGNNYILTLIVNNIDDIQVVVSKEFSVSYTSAIQIENLRVEKAKGRTANLITWQGATKITGNAIQDYTFIKNEPNFNEQSIGIGFYEDKFIGTGIQTTFQLTKQYNKKEDYVIVKIDELRIKRDYFYINEGNELVFATAPTSSTEISVLYKTNNTDSNVVFDTINGLPMHNANFPIDNNIIWQGSLEKEEAIILDVEGEYTNDLGQKTGDYSFKILNSEGTLQVVINGNVIASIASNTNTHKDYEYKYDWWTVIATATNNTISNGKRVIYINKYEMIYPLYPNKYLYPSNEIYPRAKIIKTQRTKVVYNVINKQGRINEIKLGYGQWCDYLRVDGIVLSEDSINTIIPNKTSNSSFDLYEAKRVVGNYLLANFNGDLNAGDNAGTIFTGSVVAREELDSGKQDIITIVSTDELGNIYDYGIKSGKSYKYIVYGQGESALSSAVETDYICSQFQTYSLIVAKKRSDLVSEDSVQDSNIEYQYIVEKEYLFKHNAEMGSVSNNTKVSYLSNFTRYPSKQTSAENYKSGTISGLIGIVDWYEDYDTTTEVVRYISDDFAKNFRFAGSVYIVGDLYADNWLSLNPGGEPLIPELNVAYLIQTDGNFKNIAYHWNGKMFERCGEQITDTIGGKKYTYSYRDSLETADEIFDLATSENKHFFIKDMKGGFYKVDISESMTRSINFKNYSMPITMQINWREIESTQDIALFTTSIG